MAATAAKIIGGGAGLETIDSSGSANAAAQLSDIREADAAFSTPPFLEPVKTTWWKNVGFLPGGAAKDVSEEVRAALLRFASKLASQPLPENQRFIISAPRMLASSAFAKKLARAAETVVLAADRPWQAQRSAVARAVELASGLGLLFAPGAAERFVAVVGCDTRSLSGEIAKMRDYLGEGSNTVTAADVDAVTSPGRASEPEIWGVTDAVGDRDIAAALKAFRRFETQSGAAVSVSAAVERFLRSLIAFKKGEASGVNPFVLRKYDRFAAKWAPAELRAARRRFMNLRERAVSGASDCIALLALELVRALRRRAER